MSDTEEEKDIPTNQRIRNKREREKKENRSSIAELIDLFLRPAVQIQGANQNPTASDTTPVNIHDPLAGDALKPPTAPELAVDCAPVSLALALLLVLVLSAVIVDCPDPLLVPLALALPDDVAVAVPNAEEGNALPDVTCTSKGWNDTVWTMVVVCVPPLTIC